MPRRVAILGFAPGYKEAPFDDPQTEIWGLNELYKYVPRWDRWFEIHGTDVLGETKREPTNAEAQRHLAWLRQQPAGAKPIYMNPAVIADRGAELPAAVPFPLERLIARFGRYFTSTIACMLALAIDEGFDEIGLYGIDLSSDKEYLEQRPCAEYFLGLARGMGRQVVIASSSALLKSDALYGFEPRAGEEDVVSESYLRARIRATREAHDEHQAMMHKLEGALEEQQVYLKRILAAKRGVVFARKVTTS